MSTSYSPPGDTVDDLGVHGPAATAGAGAAQANANAAAAEAKRRQSLRPLLTLRPYLLRYRSQLGFALLALTASAATMLSLPLAVRRMIDLGFGAQDASFISAYFLMLIGLGIVLAAASSSRFYFVNWLGERVVADVRSSVFERLTVLGPAFYETTHSGEVMSRLTADTTQIKAAAGTALSQALRNGIMLIGALVMMFVTSSKLSILVLAAIPLIVLPLVAYGRVVRRLSRTAQDTLADASAFASENLAAVRTMQAFTTERHVAGRYGAAVERSFEAARSRLIARAGLTALAILLTITSIVAVLWYGATAVLAGEMTAGRLSQFVLYAIFAAGALAELSEVWGEISQAAGAAERLAELLAAIPEIRSPADPTPLPTPARGDIVIRDVSFTYPTRGITSALEGISLHVPPGNMVAIVGPSGAGKTTIFNLLLRFYDPTAGAIEIDGVDIRKADLDALRGRIALVPQDVALFADTVLENIRYGRPDAGIEEIRKAAEAAYASGFIEALPDGYDTKLGERGVTLSGGQRQRIAIARAILRDAPILLLDEATSALDAESEHEVQLALERLMVGRTTIVIAHRLATVQKAPRIVVMDQGRIVEEGTHGELVQAGGLYARLARLQFSREPAA